MPHRASNEANVFMWCIRTLVHVIPHLNSIPATVGKESSIFGAVTYLRDLPAAVRGKSRRIHRVSGCINSVAVTLVLTARGDE